MNDLFKHPVWAMAFRTFYSLAALYGAFGMVCFQEVVETWGVYWFGRRLGRGWWEDLLCKVVKGRLKMGFRRPLVWLERAMV